MIGQFYILFVLVIFFVLNPSPFLKLSLSSYHHLVLGLLAGGIALQNCLSIVIPDPHHNSRVSILLFQEHNIANIFLDHYTQETIFTLPVT